MSNNCVTCGGLIMEPGKVYGYTGLICNCIALPKYQQLTHQYFPYTNAQQPLPKCECHGGTQIRINPMIRNFNGDPCSVAIRREKILEAAKILQEATTSPEYFAFIEGFVINFR